MAKPLTDYFWIVDGHNLVLNVPELTRLHSHESKRAAREAAEARLAALAEVSPNPIHLIFDGDAVPGTHPGSGERGRLVVRFVDPPAEADDWIVQLAKQESEAGQPVAVATSDRGLLARLAGGAPVHRMAVDAFWRETGRFARQLAGPPPKEKPDPLDSSADEMGALETAMSRPLSPQEKRAMAPRAGAGGSARPSSAAPRDASRERSKGPRDAREARPGAPARGPRGERGPGASGDAHATESHAAASREAPASPSHAQPPPPASQGERTRSGSAPPPPPPAPPRDWREEIAEKKQKGRERQLKRLARRKGS